MSREPAQRSSPALIDRVRRSPTTFALILITVLFFAGQMVSESLLGYDLVIAFFAKSNIAIGSGQVWRLITPIFVHGGSYHLLINMYSLYAIGPAVEQFFGHTRSLVVYVLCAISGSLLSLAFSSADSVGASGAIFGFLGALGGFLFLHRNAFGSFGRAQLRQIIVVALINLGIGFMPGIDNWGHLGGLLCGLAMSFLIGPRYEPVRLAADRMHLLDVRPFKRIWPLSVVALGVLLLFTALILQLR